ncbi:Oidioi.mRNA.OKI2018_I69.PAR.g11074.t1.cds [Oikopleura dioica]|uniref:Oidioi.mRNA.OKI2018_I69.PAR.g11074.t1.cds n=1 Tax=Oikopleura dioica TaxID=34765 RepID=A0ABN7S0M8_OIKDI|nr:Oidioi.mRNA.OKI2018_I69.PAR.g11074.t1.cds [Oikopleura dioica]
MLLKLVVLLLDFKALGITLFGPDYSSSDASAYISSYSSSDNFDPRECKNTRTGVDYRGTLSLTQSGKPCKDWRDFPRWIEKYPESDLNGPYCRNPDDDLGGPWCFTIGGSWDSCKIIDCVKYFSSNKK